jgi:hypothetical protein
MLPNPTRPKYLFYPAKAHGARQNQIITTSNDRPFLKITVDSFYQVAGALSRENILEHS